MKTKFKQFLESLINPEIEEKKYSKNFDQKSKFDPNLKSKSRHLGKGAYGSAKDHPSDPHLIVKHEYVVTPRDKISPYNVFIENIIELDMTDNLFFPRIYNVKKIIDKQNKTLHKFSLEKLSDFSEFSYDELYNVLTNSVGLSDDEIDYEIRGKSAAHNERSLHHIISEKLFYYVNGRYDLVNANPSLIKALNFIIMIAENNKLYMDIHEGNIMYRRTPYGAQLVITDPLS